MFSAYLEVRLNVGADVTPTEYTGWGEWEKKFNPTLNPFGQDPKQRSFHPHGDEQEYVKNYDHKFVWTHLHEQTSDLVVAGYVSSSDTLSYFITEKPWDSPGDCAIVALEVDCDCSKADGLEGKGFTDPDCEICGGNGFFTKVLE
jgi:hypothetical protein